jgi:hypothetical protein
MPPGVFAIVVTVSVALTAAAPLIITEAGVKEQLGAGVLPVVMLHERVTAPVYPPAGVAVIVELDALPAVTGVGLIAPAVSM